MPQKDNITTVPTSPTNGEIVLYQPDDDIRIEVRLENETVWLTQQQIADLFEKDQSVIARHIRNVFNEGELDEKSNMQILHNTLSKYKPTGIYSLDVIISVGYRVKSKRGTQFRIWANKVLKEYLLKGVAINQQLIAMQRQIDARFERQDNRMLAIEKELAEHRDKIDFFVRTNMPPVEQVFFNGQFFEARSLLERMVKTAQKRVIIIDPYIDAVTFEILDVRQKGVSADIYSNNEHTALRNTHNAAANVEPINTHLWSTPSHDRWLIIDDNLFLCGHSLKDMGKKLTAIMLMETKPEVILNVIM